MFVYKLKRIDSSDCIKKIDKYPLFVSWAFFFGVLYIILLSVLVLLFWGVGVGEKDGEGVENYVHFIVIKLNILIKPIFIFCIFIINQTINLNVYEIFYFTAHR